MSEARDAKYRALRAEIRRWKPWEKSTGPKTPEGKARSAKNGFKPVAGKPLAEWRRLLKEQRKELEEIQKTFLEKP